MEPLFYWGNFAEFVLWSVIGFVCLWKTQAASERVTRDLRRAGLTFLVFGLSDLVEIRTGAWWRPFWLLLWKGACVVILVWLVVRYYRFRRV